MKAIVIDQEVATTQSLKSMASRMATSLDIVEAVPNVTSGRAAIDRHQPDLVFLDAHLPNPEEVFLLKEKLLGETTIILTALETRCDLEYIRLQAHDFLIKPFKLDELQAVIARSRPGQSSRKTSVQVGGPKIMLPIREGYLLIQLYEILYFESAGPYTILHTRDGRKNISTRHLKTFEEQFAEESFHRIHHRFLINMGSILKVNVKNNFVLLNNGARLSISVRKKAAFLNRLKMANNF